MPRHSADGMLLHNPRWGMPAANGINVLFFEAVIDAVQLVPVSCTDVTFAYYHSICNI